MTLCHNPHPWVPVFLRISLHMQKVVIMEHSETVVSWEKHYNGNIGTVVMTIVDYVISVLRI